MAERRYRQELPMAATTPSSVDLLRIPLLGPLLRYRHARSLLQFPVLLVAIIMVWHGLAGPQLAPKNLATTLTWVQYRGVLVFVLLIAGNFFCMACPFMLVRQWLRRFIKPRFTWPRPLRNKFVAIALLVAVLYWYEAASLWSSPWLTAWLIVAYFAAAVIVDSFFKHATFCKFVCPIGQFNFVASTISPLEVKVRDIAVCETCATKDCIRGRRAPAKPSINGCELALFQPLKVGNMDCTFCLDCVHACPHDNIGVMSNTRASELLVDTRRSGIGRLTARFDLAALAVVFTFGALGNALGMVSPVYAIEDWLSRLLHVRQHAVLLGIVFASMLVVIPSIVVGAACWITRQLTGTGGSLKSIASRYAHCLIPLGFSIWLAHYSFHFLTGFWTFVPVAQSAAIDAGGSLGSPRWDLSGIPISMAHPIEVMMIGLGLLGTFKTAYDIARSVHPTRKLQAFAPWAVLGTSIWTVAAWLLSQPMDMRGTFLGSGN